MKSVIQKDCNKCFVCGKGGELHPHHIMEGTANRKKSDEDKLIVYVHNLPCHRDIHDHPKKYIYLKQYAQKTYEKNHGREEWIKRYGKSYI